jgi:hypothetical protein
MKFIDETDYTGFQRCVTQEQCEAEENTELVEVGDHKQCRCENPDHIITWNGCQIDPDLDTTVSFYGHPIEMSECTGERRALKFKAG